MQPTTLLKILSEFLVDSKVIFKSIVGPDDYSKEVSGMNGLTLMLLMANLTNTKNSKNLKND